MHGGLIYVLESEIVLEVYYWSLKNGRQMCIV